MGLECYGKEIGGEKHLILNTLSLGCGISVLIKGSRLFLPGAPQDCFGEMCVDVY